MLPTVKRPSHLILILNWINKLQEAVYFEKDFVLKVLWNNKFSNVSEQPI